jgi:sigma-B regulation protein RsbU (phosphoserine phosphatase)
MKLPRILNDSMTTRTTLLVVLLVAFTLLPGGIWQLQHVRTFLDEETHRVANKAMDRAIEVIENRIAKVETAVGTAASYGDIMAPHKQEALSMLERLIKSNDDIAAVTLLYKENYFKEEGRYYAPTISKNTETGELVVEEIGGPEFDFCYLETDSNWVYTNLLKHEYWCLPYVDSMATQRPMVTFSVPLQNKKDGIYAVLCADIDLDWVRNLVEEAKPYEYAGVVVQSRDGQYIYNTLDEDDDVVLSGDVDGVKWKISFHLQEEKILEKANKLQASMIVLLFILLTITSFGLYYVLRIQIWPIKELAKSTLLMAKGDFSALLPKIYTNDEIAQLRDSFEKMQISLARYVEELKVTTASKASIESELRIASDIQRSMLPKVFPPFPNRDDVDVFGQLTPAKAVGGDLIDFFIRDEKLFFCIGDVSGKGVPASLVMSVARAMFRSTSMHVESPSKIVKRINGAIADQNDANMFVTMFIGVLDLSTGLLRYCNAGHDAPLLIGKDVSLLPVDSNIPIGLFPDLECEVQEVQVEPGSLLFLYTDGLTEAENLKHEQFGEERMMENAQRQKDKANGKELQPMAMILNMTEDVAAFVGEAEQSDDLTMLAISYK